MAAVPATAHAPAPPGTGGRWGSPGRTRGDRRHATRELGPALGLGLAGALAILAALVALSGALSGSRARSPQPHDGLPAAAQSPISAALGRDQAAFHVRGLRAGNPAQDLHTAFSRGGVEVTDGPGRLLIRSAAFGYASALRPLPPVAPRASENRVSYRRGALTEWYLNGPLGLEQGFDVAARPAAGRGPLTLSLALSGNLAMRLQHGSLLLSAPGVALRYDGLLVTDARGRTLRSWLELLGGRLLIRIDDRGASYPLHVDPFVHQAELTASGGGESDQLGYSVAVSGGTIVVGAPFHKVGEHADQGAAYVFLPKGGKWANATQTAELTASDGGESDSLGFSVAISGNTIVAGAPFHQVGPSGHQGAAYVFTMPPGGWESANQTAELTAADGSEGDELGYSVASSENTVVAGAPDRRVGPNIRQGAAYVFTTATGEWGSTAQAAELTAADGGEGDQLGYSVAAWGNTVVAGAPFHQVGSNPDQGAAYVFAMPGGGWASTTQTGELIASDGASEDRLGFSVATAEGTVVAGAPFHQVGSNPDQGAAYVFAMPGGEWANTAQTAELIASDGTQSDQLGDSVGISEGTIVAGAPYHAQGTSLFEGAAYVYAMPAGGWENATQTEELIASDGAASDRLGESAGISGKTIVAGAPFHQASVVSKGVARTRAGTAYVFTPLTPSVSLSVPANGATYTVGAHSIFAVYTCSAPAPAVVTSCTGTVQSGAFIETGALGIDTFTATATDSDGFSASKTVTYTVVPKVDLVLPIRPVLSRVRESVQSWHEGNALAREISGRAPAAGTIFSFSLNEPASVGLEFAQPAGGRKVGHTCVAPTSKNESKHKCTRTVLAGTLTFSARTGPNKLSFEGLLSRQRRLKPGSYTLVLTATASGERSTPKTLKFTVSS
jgi:hypothetical protein